MCAWIDNLADLFGQCRGARRLRRARGRHTSRIRRRSVTRVSVGHRTPAMPLRFVAHTGRAMRTSTQQRRRRADRFLAALAGVIVAGLTITGCTGGKDAVDQQAGGQYRFVGATSKGHTIPVPKRKPAGPATGPLLAGGIFRLADYKGKVVVINFWAAWCIPCQTELPQFDLL